MTSWHISRHCGKSERLDFRTRAPFERLLIILVMR